MKEKREAAEGGGRGGGRGIDVTTKDGGEIFSSFCSSLISGRKIFPKSQE